MLLEQHVQTCETALDVPIDVSERQIYSGPEAIASGADEHQLAKARTGSPRLV